MSKPKGLYLIQEKGCLNPYAGAFQHISMGVNQLSYTFNISPYLSDKKIDLNNFKVSSSCNENITRSSSRGNYFYGTLKDLLILLKNLKSLFKLIRLYKEENIEFVYERASYLNYSGLLACKYLKIPHFYEANGLQFKSRKKYYDSCFFYIAKWLERKSYSYSDYSFFVGTYGDFWNIKKASWANVENGIEASRILPFETQIIVL